MKRLIISAFTALVLLLVGCKAEPGVNHLNPEDVIIPSKGVFPEGDSEFDELLQEIQLKYNFTIFYKNISNAKFSPPANYEYVADEKELPDSLKPHYLNFLQRHILDYFDEHTDWFPKIMKKNMFFVTNYQSIIKTTGTTFLMMMDINTNLASSTIPVIGATYRAPDHVSLCLSSDKWGGFSVNVDGKWVAGPTSNRGVGYRVPRTAAEFKRLRAQFMTVLFINAVAADKILVPPALFTDNGVVFNPPIYVGEEGSKQNLEGYLMSCNDSNFSIVGTVGAVPYRTGTGVLLTPSAKNIIEASGYFKKWGSLVTDGYTGASITGQSGLDTTITTASRSHYYDSNYSGRAEQKTLENSYVVAKKLFFLYLYQIMALDLDATNAATINTPANWYFPGTAEFLWQNANYPLVLRSGKTPDDLSFVRLDRIENVKNAIIAYMKTYGFDLEEISRGPEPIFLPDPIFVK